MFPWNKTRIDLVYLQKNSTSDENVVIAKKLFFVRIDNGTAVTTISLIGKCFIAGAFTTIHIFTTELFPTEIRNSGLGVSSVISSLGGIIAPFIDPLVKKLYVRRHLIFYKASHAVGCMNFL